MFSINKEKFIASNSDAKININDPNFWKLVFKGSKSGPKALWE